MNYRIHNSINLAKIGFIYLIVLYHSRLLDGIVNHGYIGVEFFFIVSGFFLCRTSEKNITVIKYMENRIKKLYPHYIFSFLVMLIASLITGHYYEEKFNCIAEIFMIQNLGFTKGGVNYPCWYMSVLFWGSLLIYIMLKYVPKTIDYIIMCALPVIYSSYSNVFQDGKMEIWYTEHGVYIPLIRGLADLSLGVLIYYVYKWIAKKQFYKYKIANWIIEILCIISIFILTIYPKNIDFLFVIVICILVIAIMSPNSICEKIGSFEIIRWLSQYEYAIYLNHAVIIMFFKKYIMGVAELRVAVLLIFIMVLVTMYSIFTTKFINFVVKTVLKVLKRM